MWDIIGVQLIPKQWPHHVEIICANEATKDILLNNGLKIQNQDIKIYETGLNKVKVAIDNAPLNMDNGIIKEALCEFGKAIDIRNEYLSVGGKRVPWWNGTRHVDMSHLKCELPPTLKLHIGEKEIKARVWHIGQTRIECRWCKEHVVKDEHNCPKRLWKHHSSKGGVCCGESVLQLQREQPHHTQLPLRVPEGERGYPRDHTQKDKCNKLWWHWQFPSLDQPCSTAGVPNQPSRKWTRHGSWPPMRWQQTAWKHQQ